MHDWPRARQWWIGPLDFFRNPDAGVGLSINGMRLFGPGQCGQETSYRGRDVSEWCYRPFGHHGDHAYNIADAVMLNRSEVPHG